MRVTKEQLIKDILTASINVGENQNIKFAEFVEMLNSKKLKNLKKIRYLVTPYSLGDILMFTAWLSAVVCKVDTKFVVELNKFNYPKYLNRLILDTYTLTKDSNTSFEGIAFPEDVEVPTDTSNTFIGESHTENLKVTNTKSKDVLKYYGQDRAVLEISFSTAALGKHEQLKEGKVERQDMMASMSLIAPEHNSVQATQTMLELAIQVSGQSLALHIKNTVAYETDKEGVKEDFKNYLLNVVESITQKTDDLFDNNFKFVTYEQKGKTP